MFDAYIDGLEDLDRDWTAAMREISDGIRTGVVEGVQAGVEEARALHVYKDRTGDLTNTAKGVVLVSAPGGATGEMRWPMKYASFVENGTERHIIAGNPFLHFIWKGVPMTLRYVDHPGSKPHPFAGIAYQKCERVINATIEAAVARASRFLSR